MSNKKSLGVGIVGAGFMGRTYSEAIAKFVDDAHLAGVVCGSRAPELAKDYGVPCFDTLDELLGAEGLDAIFVATPHRMHAEQATASARAGKHCLIEKPMAHTVAECDSILEAAKATGALTSVGFSQRTRVCNKNAKELLDSGRLGKIQQIRTTQMVPNGMPNLPDWQMDQANFGTLFGHGIHNFDMIRWLTGEEISTVYAKSRNLEGKNTEGHSDVLMTLSDGSTAYFLCTFQVAAPGFPRSQFALRAMCENGLLDVDAYGEARASISGGDWETIATQEPIDWQGKGFLDPVRLAAYIEHVNDFLDAIREGRGPAITGWDGRQAVAAALAAYESSQTGKEIGLK